MFGDPPFVNEPIEDKPDEQKPANNNGYYISRNRGYRFGRKWFLFLICYFFGRPYSVLIVFRSGYMMIPGDGNDCSIFQEGGFTVGLGKNMNP